MISLLLPLLEFTVYYKEVPANIAPELPLKFATGVVADLDRVTPGVRSGNGLQVTDLALAAYLFVSMIILLKFFFSLYKIRRIINTHSVEKFPALNFVRCEEPGTPFSFFRWLFWNKKIAVDSPEGEQIFRHEWFHIRQKHSLDLILLELVTVLFWINPFFHLMKKETRAIHEFQADRFAIGGSGTGDYAELLLQQAFLTRIKFTHPFFQNQIKRRIAMINPSNFSGSQYLRKLMVFPIAAALIFIFSFSFRTRATGSPGKKERVVVIDAGHGGNTGAKHGNIQEDLVVLNIAKKISELNNDNTIRIILTRSDNSNPSLVSRKSIAESNNAELYISLHVAAGKHKDGISIYVPSKRKNDESLRLARGLVKELGSVYQTREKLVLPENSIFVLEKILVPSVLLELGNISDPEDQAFLGDQEKLDEIALAILRAIREYSQN